MAPSVAFTLLTRAGPARVRALVETMRPHVDEVVVGIDTSAAPGTAAAISDLCDRLFRFPGMPHASIANPYQVMTCSTEWVLRLDEDEMPGQSLLDALPDLVADRRVSQFELKRRWLWPDPEHWITTFPWGFEPSARLTRNIAGLIQADGRLHSFEHVVGEHRLVDAFFYHADILRPYADRRAKIAAYQGQRGELRYGDFPVNGIYLPEETGGVELAPVPEEDRDHVRRLIDPPDPGPLGPDPELELISYDELIRPTLMRETSPKAHEGRLELVGTPSQVRAEVVHQQELRVTNDGDEWWPSGDRPQRPIRIGWKWRAPGSDKVVREGRDLLPETVRPGETVPQVLTVSTPPITGPYVLEVQLIHEHVSWFGVPARAEIDVVHAAEHPLFAPPQGADADRAAKASAEAAALRAELSLARSTVRELTESRRYRLGCALANPLDRARALLDRIRS